MQKRLPRNANGCNTCKTERTLARNLPHTHSTALSRKGQAGTANQQTHVMTSASFPTCTSQAPGPRRMHPQTLEPEFGLDARVYPDGPGRSSDASEPLRLAACTAAGEACRCGPPGWRAGPCSACNDACIEAKSVRLLAHCRQLP